MKASKQTSKVGPQLSPQGKIYSAINIAALRDLRVLLARWLPGGHLVGREYEAINPRRDDARPGSFRINISNGKWADFATDDCGGDPISLATYLFNLPYDEAAGKLADMLGVPRS